MSPAQVIALQDDSAEAGAVVYWSLSGCPPLATVRAALASAGVPESALPGAPSPAVALHQAATLLFGACLVRPLPKKGVAIVEERETTDGSLAYDVLWHAETPTPDDVLVSSGPDQAWTAEEREIVQRQLAFGYREALSSCPASHLGDWLVRRVAMLAGVPLRSRGSVYYLPPEGVREYRRIRSALGQLLTGTSYRLFAIPAVRGSEAVSAVLSAVIAEAEEEAASMEADLLNPIGERALDNRVARCTAITDKVTAYETLLQQKAGAITDRLGNLQAQLAAAYLTTPRKDR